MMFLSNRLFLGFIISTFTTVSFPLEIELQKVNEWAEIIGGKIWSLTEDINKLDDLRKKYTKSLKEVDIVNPETLLKDSARDMEHYFGKKIDSLKRIKERAEKLYKEKKSQTITEDDVKYVNMININNNGSNMPVTLAYDNRFKKPVNTSYSGIQIPANVYEKGSEVLKTIYWTSGLDEVFKENINKRDPTLKWQYFGSHDAVFRTYPAKSWTNLHYSARRRPWYTQGAASPKSMIILVDRSGSMVGQTSFIARLAVSNLIDTLSENDFLNILYFNNEVTSLSCNNTLVQATKRNREWFKQNLITSDPINSANWNLALTEAFEILKQSPGAECQKMIMIFSDGTEERQKSVFDEYNKNKQVRIFTYLVGTPSHSSDDLTWMACSNKGHYYRIRTVGAVRDRIEDYVSVLSRPMIVNYKQQHPVWTGVYRDASGLGMMVTGTLPVFSDGNFLGVCGTDVTVDELKNVFYAPYLGANGYSFLINNNGHIVRHPNLRSMLGYVKSSGDVDIVDAEFVPNESKDKLLNLRKQMLSVDNGAIKEVTLDAFSFTEYNYYLRAYPTQRHYYYTKLMNTPFSLAIALSQYGYQIKQLQPFPSTNGLGTGLVYLNDWSYCGNKTFPQQTTENNLRRLLQGDDCKGGVISDYLFLDLNITENLEKHWNITKTRHKITFAFIQTNWGLLRISDPFRVKEVNTETLMQRIRTFYSDFIIVTTPYNLGDAWNDDSSASILVSQGVKINVTNLRVVPAVVGYQIKEDHFLKDYLNNASFGNTYHVYLLDENAFIVSSSLNSTESVTGKFFGTVDWELMSELENQLYTRYSFRNEQGECVESSSKSTSSSTHHTLYSTFGTLLRSWVKTILGCILQLDLYNWMTHVDGATEKTISKQPNRSCVTNMTTYYANITTWKSFDGNTSCLNCGNEVDTRRYFVAPVPRTNLVLVVVEYFENKTKFQYTKRTNGIPGKHVEIHNDINQCKSDVMSYRRRPARCVTSESEEKEYSCGEGDVSKPNICLLLLVLFFIPIYSSSYS